MDGYWPSSRSVFHPPKPAEIYTGPKFERLPSPSLAFCQDNSTRF